jgi:hypothetical protein
MTAASTSSRSAPRSGSGVARGRPAKTSHHDRLLIRALWRQGRTPDTRKLSAKEIAAKLGVSYMTVYRVVVLDEVEMADRERDELERLSRSRSADSSGTS